jgi:phosphonate transport system substrate-binding protein
MMHPRYQNCPIYYSDVVVRQDSSFDSFKDLRGCTWAINEPASHSGCWITRYHLACLGETVGFFGKVVQSGAHQISLQWILQNKIDAAAIDSTVLEFVLAQDPAMASALRIIDSWGPSPIPPWLIHRHVPAEIRTALRETLAHMHRDPVGQQILRKGQTARFVSVQDRDYDPLRQMLQVGSGVMLNLDPVDRHPTATTPGILKQAKDL